MHGLIFETSVWLLAGSTRLISFQKSKDTEIENKQSQTNRHTARKSTLAPRTTRRKRTSHAAHHHVITCRFAFIALSEERQKHRSKPCASRSTPLRIPLAKSKQKPNRNRKTRKSNIISAAGSTGFPTQQQQRQSIQFHSTKLNQFSQSFNAQLSPARNSHTHNQQSRLNRARGNKAAQSSQ